MIYVTVWFKESKQAETKSFNNVKSALRFMYTMRGKNHIISGYYCDDPFDTEWLNRRFKL